MKQRLTIFFVSVIIILTPVCLAVWISSDSGGKIHASDISGDQIPGEETRDPGLEPDENLTEPPVTPDEVFSVLSAGAEVPSFMDYDFVLWLEKTAGSDVYRQLMHKASAADLADSLFWYEISGMTLHALKDLYAGTAVPSGRENGIPVKIVMTGDVCLADDWETMAVLEEKGGVLSECITGGLLERMNAADLTLVNNEFVFSDRGEPLENKYYTFRSSPSNVSLLAEMGVDIVSLANNHVYDYGSEAFIDTIETLEGAGIEYTGGGRNIADASSPRYYIVNGIKIAFVAATRAEKMPFTPEAGEHRSGVLRTYKPDRFMAVISEAKANADYVIAYPHWGTENTEVLEKAQTEQARQYIDAGADAVVGSHPHCLQEIEFYKDKPIVYSLGNFWFNHEDGETALLEITADGTGLAVTLVPCLQTGGVTTSAAGTDDGKRILEYIEGISSGIDIDESGRITAAAGR